MFLNVAVTATFKNTQKIYFGACEDEIKNDTIMLESCRITFACKCQQKYVYIYVCTYDIRFHRVAENTSSAIILGGCGLELIGDNISGHMTYAVFYCIFSSFISLWQ